MNNITTFNNNDDVLNIIKDNWNTMLERMRTDFEVSEASIKTWCKDIISHLHSYSDGVVIFTLPEEPAVKYVNKKYAFIIKQLINEYVGQTVDVKFVWKEDLPSINTAKLTKPPQSVNSYNLNPKYTFDTFVVGDNNKFAHAYSLAVAESPGEDYNPFFIHGGVGLGKTHLMHSIANFMLAADSTKKVTYITSEDFTNEIITAIQNHDTISFREKYRHVDILLVDDIQFISNKESTQEEFFNTFNALYNANKQIVISSDRPPKELSRLEERISSRFQQGLVVEIQPPTYETSMAILNKKIEINNYNIPNDVKEYIVKNINSNIRELEGALKKVTCYASLCNAKDVTLELAKESLKDYISPNTQHDVTLEYIIQVVAEHFNISIKDIISAKRKQTVAYPRQIAMYLCRECTDETWVSIGKHMGDRDHTTILHGYDKINKELSSNSSTKQAIDILLKKINPN